MDAPMNKRVALVTGASAGLGLNIVRELLGHGVRVVGVARRSRAETDALGPAFTLALGDVAQEETARKAFDVAESLGVIDILVNCAGVGVFGAAGTFGRQDVDEVLAGNLVGTMLFCEQAAKRFREGATIVNVMSTAAQAGRPNESLYCAAKWGARGYTESIRAELKGRKIRVMAVYPGGMNTGFWAGAQGSTADSSKFMDPAEVARTVVASILASGTGYVSDLVISRA